MNTFLKYTTAALYAFFLFAFLISVFGKGSTSGPLNIAAQKTLERAGLHKNIIDSLDRQIDESIYTIDTYTYQIKKLANILSGDEITPPRKTKHEYIAAALYYPVISGLVLIMRIMLTALSFIFLLSAIVFNLMYKLSSLNMRLKILERKINETQDSQHAQQEVLY